MRLYDTARREVVPFEPGPEVLMYTCGITPYDATHLGHAATFITYDVLQRRLIDTGHTVKCVLNVTDVDDPLFAKARELGVHYLDLAAGEEARFATPGVQIGLFCSTPMVALSRTIGRKAATLAEMRESIAHAHRYGTSVLVAINTFARAGNVELWQRAVDDATPLQWVIHAQAA